MKTARFVAILVWCFDFYVTSALEQTPQKDKRGYGYEGGHQPQVASVNKWVEVGNGHGLKLQTTTDCDETESLVSDSFAILGRLST